MTSHNPSDHNMELSVHDDLACESTTTLASLDLSTLLDAMPKITQTDHFARLPNELIESILKRFEVPNLIPLRLVNPRWNVIIESMCHKQKLLALVSPHFAIKLQDRFDGQLDLSRLVYLKLKRIDPNFIESSVDLCSLLGKLFPRVEHLFVDRMIFIANVDFVSCLLGLWSSSLVTLYFSGKIIIGQQNVPQICSLINGLTNLKNLDMAKETRLPLKSLATTLKRLNHLSFGLFDSPKDSWYELLDNLGPHCTSLRVDMHIRAETDGFDWPIRIAQSPITHLHLNAFDDFKNFVYRVFPGQFAATLRSLHISNQHTNIFSLHTSTLKQLSILKQLTYLRIDGPTQFYLSVFYDAPTPMPNIRSFALCTFRLYSEDAELFCRLFSTIFPNLERLTLHYQDPRFGGKVRPFLNLFKALRYHDISFVE